MMLCPLLQVSEPTRLTDLRECFCLSVVYIYLVPSVSDGLPKEDDISLPNKNGGRKSAVSRLRVRIGLTLSVAQISVTR